MSCRTLLFGAGQGALQYMANTASTRTFIGFLDNDENKQGTLFEGLPVYSPAQLGEIAFDQIVISTQWALDVYQQLLDDLNIPEEKVVLPQKNKLKKATPFDNPESLKLGRTIIRELNRLAMGNDIPLVVDFGTLLGLVRDNDIIQWDDDIDFSAPFEHAGQVEMIVLEFTQTHRDLADFTIERVTDKRGREVCILLKFTDPQSKLTQFTTSLCYRENADGHSLHMPSLGMWYAPEVHFSQLETIEWQGEKIQVPHQYREYLSFQYGDWQKPKKNIQLSDYAHLRKVEFADIQNADFKAKKVSEKHEV